MINGEEDLVPREREDPAPIHHHGSARRHKYNSGVTLLVTKIAGPESAIFGDGRSRSATPECVELASDCWCGKNSVWIPQADAGRTTRACGRRNCSAPEGVENILGEKCPRGNKGKR